MPELSLKTKLLASLGDWVYKLVGKKDPETEPDFSRMGESKDLFEKLIKEELKVLNGKKMVRN